MFPQSKPLGKIKSDGFTGSCKLNSICAFILMFHMLIWVLNAVLLPWAHFCVYFPPFLNCYNCNLSSTMHWKNKKTKPNRTETYQGLPSRVGARKKKSIAQTVGIKHDKYCFNVWIIHNLAWRPLKQLNHQINMLWQLWFKVTMSIFSVVLLIFSL